MNRKIIFYGVLVFVAVFAFLISACDDNSACAHDSGTWHTTLEPSCTIDGSKELRCTKCGHVLETKTIDAECNCTDCSCETCECECENCEVDECEHEFTLWQITRTATCTVKAEETEKCSRCLQLGTTTREAGELAPHTWIKSSSTEADCTDNATETWTCSVCTTPDPERNPLVLENTAECNCTTCVCETCECDCPNCAVVEYWTITWHFNGGTAGFGASHPPHIEKGDTLTQPTNPTKNNANFIGWFTDAALTIPYIFGVLNGNITLYAKWQQVNPMFYWGAYFGTGARQNTNTSVWNPMGTFNLGIFEIMFNHLLNTGENGQGIQPTGQPPFILEYANGFVSSNNQKIDDIQTSLTLGGTGYLFFITQNELNDITVGGLTMFGAFTSGTISIDGNDYFIYYNGPTPAAGSEFNLNFLYK
ncbi:MAG: InlB B-repeat-containing protein [Treponema sp.]|nr:InlB B-repeat-containing protein [Treponema sp.]